MEGAADTFRQTLSDKNVRRRVQIVKLLKVDIDKASAACQQWLEEMGETPDEPS
jgi:thiol:disulfide interchange protein